MRNVLLWCLLMMSVAWAATVRVNGVELPTRVVDGQSLVERAEVVKVFSEFPSEGSTWVGLEELAGHPSARVTRRDGRVTAVRFYTRASAAVYEPPHPRPSQEESPQQPPSELVQEIIELCNQRRAEHGAPPLSAHPLLARAAVGHSQEMLDLDYFAHESPIAGRETVMKRVLLTGASPLRVGENLFKASGVPVTALADQTVECWMNSPGHRQNLLNPAFSRVGIGIALKGIHYTVTQVLADGL